MVWRNNMGLKDKIIKSNDENKEKIPDKEGVPSDEEMMKVFDDINDVELILLEEEAYRSTSDALDKLLSGENFEDNINECIGSLHALYIYLKVCKERNIKDKTVGELIEQYQDLLLRKE